MTTFARQLLGLAAVAALAAPLAATAQSAPSGDAEAEAPRQSSGRGGRVKLTPYIEAGQVMLAELSPGNEVVTYSVIAAGLDASVRGRNNEGAISLRYERRFGWGSNQRDGDTISGLARVSAAVVPKVLQIEAGALATRTGIENNGSAVLGQAQQGDAVTQIYSVYAGPTLTTRAGDVTINGGYRIGYTRIETPDAVVLAPGQTPVDLFDDSVVHSASLRAASRAGEALPIGVAVGASYNREDISNLDQRLQDFNARADVTVPISSDVALLAGVGYEDVEVSSRDALRDGTGAPVIGPDGRFVTDSSAPRRIAYQSEGLVWDAGVMWRPSRRTALEAHVGRRYGSTTYYGSFAYAPNSYSSINVAVYDSISGFGGRLNTALAGMPTQFEAARNPFSGDLTGCVVSQEQGSCISGALGSVRSSVFRSRGVMATYARNFGRMQAGIGTGYDRRSFIAAAGTVLAVANGVIDENYWMAAYINGRIDAQSRYSFTTHANWFQTGDSLAGDGTAYGATAAYYRSLTSHLTATAALGIDGVNRELLEDVWSAQALLGVRYSF